MNNSKIGKKKKKSLYCLPDGKTVFMCYVLKGSIVVGIAYDCRDNHVYWTDLSARTINRASVLSGAEPEILISTSKTSFHNWIEYSHVKNKEG